MRCRMLMVLLAGCMAVGSTHGQIQTRPGSGDRTIQHNWPEDWITGAPLTGREAPNWDARDAVGLQFKDAAPKLPQSNVVPVKLLEISGRARKEMQKSDKALKAGDIQGSAEHLGKMLQYGPDLAIVHNSLGTRYVALREYENAVAEFQKAVALEPNYRIAVDNIVVAMCMQHKYTEAEPAARWALQIQPEASSSKYLLGSVLIEEGKITDEANRLLQSVKVEYPRARLFLAKALALRGNDQQAAEELREYLKSPQAADNGVAEEWLGRIEKQLSAKKVSAGQPSQHE
jgi:tetratricopeptide (TPR) repeat protein